MFTSKKILANSLLIGLIIIIAGILYFLFQKIYETKYEPLDAIPETTSFFIQFNSAGQLYRNLSANLAWDDILNLTDFKNIKKQLREFDSILHLNNRNRKFVEQQNAIISLHHKDKKAGLLLIVKLKGNQNHTFFSNFFKEAFGETYASLKTTIKGHKVYKLVFSENKKPFFYTIAGGLFIGSQDEDLLAKSLDQLTSNKKFKADPAFNEIAKTAGKKVDANLYINYKNIPGFFKLLAGNSFNNASLSEVPEPEGLQKFSNTANWSELDLTIHPKKILFSGFTDLSDSGHYLNIFVQQNAQSFEMAKIIPSHATLINHLGISNLERYISGYQNFLKLNNNPHYQENNIQLVNKKLGAEIQKSLFPNIGNTLALVSTAASANDFEEKTYALISLKNVLAVKNLLTSINSANGKIKSTNYRSFELGSLNFGRLVPLIFGETFSPVRGFHYTFINDFLVVANSAPALKDYLDAYLSGKTLDQYPDFISFSNNMAEKSNFYFYYNIQNGLNLLQRFTNNETYEFIAARAAAMMKFQAIGIQYSMQPQGMFTNLCLSYNPDFILKKNALWEAKLDHAISGKPQLVSNHKDQNLNILVTDNENNLYLFDEEGKELWKYKTDGKLLGQVHEVDYYKNGKIQYLFNTQNTIYLIDILGRDVEGYPLKLKKQAINGISVFDYSNNRDYRIIYAGTDKKIYNYGLDGNEIKGWNKMQTSAPVTGEIQHLVANNRDYILFSDVNGKTNILNRMGRDRILLKSPFNKAKNSIFYVNETNKKGLFLTTNTNGKLIYIASNGQLSTTDFGNYSDNHFFFYDDFDNDGNPDFIFIDQGILNIFNRFKQKLLTYQFNKPVITPPVLYKKQDGTVIIGIYPDESDEIFLFTKNGKIKMPYKINGSNAYSIGSLPNNENVNLLVGTSTRLENHLIKRE